MLISPISGTAFVWTSVMLVIHLLELDYTNGVTIEMYLVEDHTPYDPEVGTLSKALF